MKYIKLSISLFFLFLIPKIVFGSEIAATTTIENINKDYSINLDLPTINRGYTVAAFNELKLSLVPGILSDATPVEVIKLNEELPLPWELEKISNTYQFEFKNKLAYDNHKPFYIQFNYTEEDNYLKQVYFFDKNYSAWRPLPTTDFPKEKFVRSLIHLPYARIAVFSNHSILTVGRASWYAYKGGNFAASPDFAKGSKLRVKNLDNDKYVDVIINDYGPERKIFPDRVVDLDKVAFTKIASLGAGVANIQIEVLDTAGGTAETKIESSANLTGPSISSKSAIVFNETTGEILYNKNSTTTMPLASLTKLLAVKVFLDTRPTLTQVVTYNKQDELYNYEWCEPWESARLKVDEGETMTIEDLLYASLVGSANNSIESLVRVSGYTRDQFIAKMNSVARELGASSTHFVEPTGLSPNNITTAYDYALIVREIFKHPILEKASKMPEYKFATLNTEEPHTLKNTNSLIRYNNFHNYNLTGSKTGYLHEALYCLMLRAKADNGDDITVVTLAAPDKTTSLNETEELLRYGLKMIES